MTVDDIVNALEAEAIDFGGFVSIQVDEEHADEAMELIEEYGGRINDANPHEAGVTISFDTDQF